MQKKSLVDGSCHTTVQTSTLLHCIKIQFRLTLNTPSNYAELSFLQSNKYKFGFFKSGNHYRLYVKIRNIVHATF